MTCDDFPHRLFVAESPIQADNLLLYGMPTETWFDLMHELLLDKNISSKQLGERIELYFRDLDLKLRKERE